MPLTQTEIAQAINNLSMIDTTCKVGGISEEQKEMLHAIIFDSLKMWGFSKASPDGVPADDHDEDE